MSDIQPPLAPTTRENSAEIEEIQASLHELERRGGGPRWIAVIVIFLLLIAAGSLALTLPSLSASRDRSGGVNLEDAIRGLAAVVVIFIIYALYQQLAMKKMRGQMAKHLGTLMRAQSQAEAFRRLATVDPLTGLHNRRDAEQLLAGEMARAQRYNQPLAVLMLDLNGFKQVNDRYGHATGDVVLREFANRLKSAIRGSDTAMRMGGDEFLVLLPGTLPEGVRHLVRRLEEIRVRVGEAVIDVTFAAGMAGWIAGETPAQILERADQALYAQKRSQKSSAPLSVE